MHDEKLYTFIKEFIFKIYSSIQPAIDNRYIKPRYDKYPNVKYHENGMPTISFYSNEAPYKLNDIFNGWDKKSNIDLNEIPEFVVLKNYLIQHPKFKSRYFIPSLKNEKIGQNFLNHITSQVPIDLLERYFLLNDSLVDNEPLLLSIYNEFENYIYLESLTFDISIPILFMNFEADEFKITDGVSIRKISEQYQRSRFGVRSYSPAVLDPVISSATHELVLKNYTLKNEEGTFFSYSAFDHESAYPVAKFETFLNAIKIVTNENSGFAQILVYPKNWADHYNMDLPCLKGVSVKRYPNYFEDFYWNTSSLPKIDNAKLLEIASVFNSLINNNHNKIQIANKRLRYSYLRDNEEDSILDIIIALETLLSDNEKSELTYKLSMRIANLISYFTPNYNSVEVFTHMKKIYDYRSAVVHGSNKLDSKREIKIENKPAIKTISLANDYLREILKILILNPKYLDPKEIDLLLLNRS
jgi:hypothetical protein